MTAADLHSRAVAARINGFYVERILGFRSRVNHACRHCDPHIARAASETHECRAGAGTENRCTIFSKTASSRATLGTACLTPSAPIPNRAAFPVMSSWKKKASTRRPAFSDHTLRWRSAKTLRTLSPSSRPAFTTLFPQSEAHRTANI